MGPGTADAGVIVKPPSAKQPTPEQSFRASGTAIFEALATKLAEHLLSTLLTTRGARVICFGWVFGWLVVGLCFARG